ncbi:hypothetical protein IGI58_003076 [Enterococcus sp. AZ020]|uniref:hypothetical protein n=1 Tax=Enterococcus sp. AZ192 TaxID=2774648 RepID=UPI003D2DC56C
MQSEYRLLSSSIYFDLGIIKRLVENRPLTLFITGLTVDIQLQEVDIYTINSEDEDTLEFVLLLLKNFFKVEEIIV